MPMTTRRSGNGKGDPPPPPPPPPQAFRKKRGRAKKVKAAAAEEDDVGKQLAAYNEDVPMAGISVTDVEHVTPSKDRELSSSLLNPR